MVVRSDSSGAFSRLQYLLMLQLTHVFSYFLYYMRACKCQLFTEEGSRRLPKCLNVIFSVLASPTDQLI